MNIKIDAIIEDTHLSHEVGDARLLVVVVLEVLLPPRLPVEVLDLLELLEVVELVLESPVPLPGHHPDVSPLVPERLGPRVLDASLPGVLAHARPAALPVPEPRPGAPVRGLPGPGAHAAAQVHGLVRHGGMGTRLLQWQKFTLSLCWFIVHKKTEFLTFNYFVKRNTAVLEEACHLRYI